MVLNIFMFFYILKRRWPLSSDDDDRRLSVVVMLVMLMVAINGVRVPVVTKCDHVGHTSAAGQMTHAPSTFEPKSCSSSPPIL